MIIVEKREASLEEWEEILDCELHILSKLIDHGVLVRRKNLWRLSFVGTIVLPKSAWISIPAAAEHHDKGSRNSLLFLERLLQVLEEYNNRSKNRNIIADKLASHLSIADKATSPLRELELLASLIEWTSSFGFHTTETERSSASFSDPIDWPRTFSHSLAISSPSGLVFDDPVRTRTVNHLSPLAIEQAKAISRLFYKYKDVANITIKLASDIEIEANDILSAFGNEPDLLLSELNEAYHSTNRDHDKDLINLLMSNHDIKSAKKTPSSSISLFGTSAFELVWEDICRYLCEGELTSEARLSRAIYNIETNSSPSWVDSQRPDIVVFEKDYTILLDAKYYAKFPKQLPGLEDVRKQIFYQLTLPHGNKGITAFLLPYHSSEPVTYFGLAKMVTCNGSIENDDTRFPPVHCLGLDWETALEAYIGSSQKKHIKKEIIRKVILKRQP